MIDLSFAECLSLAALVASGASAVYAKRQSESARASYVNDYRSKLAERHSRFQDELRKVKKENKDSLSKLSDVAGAALDAITKSADIYCLKDHGERPLRHLLHESSEMVYYAFKGQLGWQTGLNISMRFHYISYIQDKLSPDSDWTGGSNFRRTIEVQYWKDPNSMLESKLTSDRYFCGLIRQLESHMDIERRSEFINGIQDALAPFYAELDVQQSAFRNYNTRLTELIEEGCAEHFPLSESGRLYGEMRRYRATLDTLAHLSIPKIKREDAHHYANFVSLAIQACAVLHAIQGVEIWGWERSNSLSM
ncbi:hypothetical protein ACPWR0_02990 [Pandoraea pneumonica]|uniref:hypothetical protein n=1 Tax=Pandoraea pneumonica TaxID=2508299 RepID=UPI003CFA237C